MKKLVYAIVLILGFQQVIAQDIDEQRMKRDLEVAKNILATLMKNDSDMFFGGGRGIEADYVDGYGVIITIQKHFMYFNVTPPRIKIPKVKVTGNGHSYNFHIESDNEWSEDYTETNEPDSIKEQAEIEEKQAEIEEKQAEIAQTQAEIAEVQAKITEEQAREIEKQITIGMQDWQSGFEDKNEEIEEALITFLADYADLIGQLKPDDKIMIKQESPYDQFVFIGVQGEDRDHSGHSPPGISMEVRKKDISDYKSGKIPMEEFENRIEITREESVRKVADLDMFAGIFKQYFSPRLSGTFFTEGTPSYDVLDNYGVIFKIRTYSSYVEGDVFRMPALAGEKVNSEDRKMTIESLYPTFISDLKNFIVDYGRTIRSLDDNDLLTLKISLTKCDDCSIPKSIDVSVEMSVLKQFDQQKISREKAINAIGIKENP